MKTGIIGSRNLLVQNFTLYVPEETSEIVSGGAIGVDTCAREYAHALGIKLTEFLPDYPRYGRKAPLIRNMQIIEYCDIVLAFWDGMSRGTKYVINNCINRGVPIKIYLRDKTSMLDFVDLPKDKFKG
ncbi:MAG: hypothetical protein FWC55_02530 [Firmicutes bacterium]|nr:hypothetical protein [Bacillota bacterium]